MEKYKIKFSKEAKNDYFDIIRYIKYNLLEPTIANKYSILINEEIEKLEYNPQRFAIADIKIKNYSIKNNVIFYN